jgi:hypothetical protein
MAVDRRGNQTQLSARWATRIARFDYRLTAEVPPYWPLDLAVV